MERLGGWVVRHRMITMLAWLAITVVGLMLAPSLSSRLVSGSHVSGPGYAADAKIASEYGGATADPGVTVIDFPAGSTVRTPHIHAELNAVRAAIARSAPSLRIVDYASTGSATLVGAGGASTIVLAYPPHNGDDMGPAQADLLTRAAKAAAPDLTMHGTSGAALRSAASSGRGNSTVTTELMIGAI